MDAINLEGTIVFLPPNRAPAEPKLTQSSLESQSRIDLGDVTQVISLCQEPVDQAYASDAEIAAALNMLDQEELTRKAKEWLAEN